MEAPIYGLCKNLRGKDSGSLDSYLSHIDCGCTTLQVSPILNRQNKRRFKVLLSLITEIVARESGTSDYALNKPEIEVEHIWSNHFEEHVDEFATMQEFAAARDTIGDLLVLPKSFNASYGDAPYSQKVEHYYSQNILAQSLNKRKYENNPGFLQFVRSSGLKFVPYDRFMKQAIVDRTELYKSILEWNWRQTVESV